MFVTLLNTQIKSKSDQFTISESQAGKKSQALKNINKKKEEKNVQVFITRFFRFSMDFT